jgi:phosphate transport system substrate-binding protein
MTLTRTLRASLIAAAVALVALASSPLLVAPAGATTYVPITGSGSTWSQNALNQWIADVSQYGMKVNYTGDGSSQGRADFLDGTVDFAASDIPFQSHPTDGSAPEDPAPGTYAYIPVTAGGTAFMYNLTINGQQVTDLRLSGENIAKIFTGQITNWSDAAIAADNPQLTLPNETIVPVVRSDGSGSSFQFSAWMIAEYPNVWNSFCDATGHAGECGPTSYFPTTGNMIAQNGDLGVAGYVAQSYAEGAIGYVNYSYALNAKFPVAQMLNAAGYYTAPTPDNVAVSLLQAQVDTTDTDPSLYLTQKLGGVYSDTDPRTYPLSSYSYMIIPTTVAGQFSQAKGKTLGAFAYYAMCQGQQESASLGYSPMPYNLVQDTFTQIQKIPGEAVPSFDLASCGNPTIDPHNASDPNLLASTAPMPPACAKQGSTQCADPTGGATQPTTLNGGGSSGGGGGGGGGSSSSGGSGGSGVSGGSSGSGSSSGGGGSGSSVGSGSGSSAATGSASGGTSATSSGGAAGGTTPSASGSVASTGTATGRAGTVSSATGRTAGGATATGSGTRTTSAAACDPSSGTCVAAAGDPSSAGSSSGDSNGDSNGVSAADGVTQSAVATTTTVAAARGWTGTQTLMVLIALLLAGLVLAPGLASRLWPRRDV